MSNIDINVKNFLKINSVFAQLFEKIVYHGTAYIDPEKLKELDTAGQDTIEYGNGRFKGLERLRDAQKMTMLFEDKAAFQIIMGVEGQADIHYYMPVRCMELDALSYSIQCRKISQDAKEHKKLKKFANGVPRGTKIIPVVTLVFYTGRKPWDGPRSIYDMFDVPETMKGWLLQAAPDYKMNLIDARHMTVEQLNEFAGDLKAFLLMLQEHFSKKQLEKQLKTAVAMHRETWYALSKIKNDKRYAEYIDKVSDADLEGGIYMDATLDYVEKRGEKLGEKRVIDLYQLLANDQRLDEWNLALKDDKILLRLLKEYSLI